MGLKKGSANFRWVLSSLMAPAVVIELQISNLSLRKLKYNTDKQPTEENEKITVGNIPSNLTA
jgi:hypothetical protein